MAPSRREMARENGTAVSKGAGTETPRASSKLPAVVRFPLVALLSFSMSSILYTFLAAVNDEELGRIAKRFDDDGANGWYTASFAISWRVFELLVNWSAGFDDQDALALTTLAHTPYLYLIHTFHSISVPTIVAALFIDIASIALPFRLLRPRSPTHSSTASSSAVPNQPLIQDYFNTALTSALGSGIFAFTFIVAIKGLSLTSFLITHFDEIETLEAIHAVNFYYLVPLFFPLGWSLRSFIYSPSLGYEAQTSSADAKAEAFNPATATLGETMKWNLWAWSSRSKVLIKRITIAAFMVIATGTEQSFMRVQGSELYGAFGWSAVWGVPVIVGGLFYGYVGDV